MPCINRFGSRPAMLRSYCGLSTRAQGSLSSSFLLHWTLCPNSLSGLEFRASSIYVNSLGTHQNSPHQPFLLKGEGVWMFLKQNLSASELVLSRALSDKWCFGMFAATYCWGKSHGSRSQYSDNRGRKKEKKRDSRRPAAATAANATTATTASSSNQQQPATTRNNPQQPATTTTTTASNRKGH